MKLPKGTLRVAVCVVALIGLSTAPVAADFTTPDEQGGGVVMCKDKVWYNVALIDYSDVANGILESQAMTLAEVAIEKCNLEGREQVEVAGEIVAHSYGEDAPWPLDPGAWIQIAGSGYDPQEGDFACLVTDAWLCNPF